MDEARAIGMPRGAYKKSKVGNKMNGSGGCQMVLWPPVSPLASAMNRREPARATAMSNELKRVMGTPVSTMKAHPTAMDPATPTMASSKTP